MRVLDLFCGAGLVARGLLLAGFDSVTGVDLDASGAKHYPGDFVRADALRLPLDPRGFDFVWASPPCPKYSKARCMNPATFASSESAQVDLIAPVREALDEAFRAGGPHYAIENVVGAPLSVSPEAAGADGGFAEDHAGALVRDIVPVRAGRRAALRGLQGGRAERADGGLRHVGARDVARPPQGVRHVAHADAGGIAGGDGAGTGRQPGHDEEARRRGDPPGDGPARRRDRAGSDPGGTLVTRGALPYYGGKHPRKRETQWIVSQLPVPGPDDLYAEPFCGMCGVLLSRRRTSFEMICDINDRLINWWLVVRDRPEEFGELLELTPQWSQGVFERATNDLDCDDPVRRALAYHIVVAGSMTKQDTATNGQWSAMWSGAGFSMPVWGRADISALQDRTRQVLIRNDDGVEALERLAGDSRNVIYCDPPYSSADTKNYRFLPDYDRLREALLAQKGQVAVSGYGSEWGTVSAGAASRFGRRSEPWGRTTNWAPRRRESRSSG